MRHRPLVPDPASAEHPEPAYHPLNPLLPSCNGALTFGSE